MENTAPSASSTTSIFLPPPNQPMILTFQATIALQPHRPWARAPNPTLPTAAAVNHAQHPPYIPLPRSCPGQGAGDLRARLGPVTCPVPRCPSRRERLSASSGSRDVDCYDGGAGGAREGGGEESQEHGGEGQRRAGGAGTRGKWEWFREGGGRRWGGGGEEALGSFGQGGRICLTGFGCISYLSPPLLFPATPPSWPRAQRAEEGLETPFRRFSKRRRNKGPPSHTAIAVFVRST